MMKLYKKKGVPITVDTSRFNQALKQSVDAMNAAGMKAKDLISALETGTLRKSIKP